MCAHLCLSLYGLLRNIIQHSYIMCVCLCVQAYRYVSIVWIALYFIHHLLSFLDYLFCILRRYVLSVFYLFETPAALHLSTLKSSARTVNLSLQILSFHPSPCITVTFMSMSWILARMYGLRTIFSLEIPCTVLPTEAADCKR